MPLPQKGVTVRFPPSDQDEVYQLLELPPDILKAVDGGESVSLTIKGRPSDDAVLCTHNKTWALRGVSISNSLLVLRPPASDSGSELHIRGIQHEVLECVPAAGRTERLHTVLRDSSWRGLGIDLWTPRGKRKREGKRYTRAQISSIIQASEEELDKALRANNIVEVDGHMLLLTSDKLGELLALLLALLTVHSNDEGAKAAAPARSILDALADDHDVPHDLGRGVMGLFGDVVGDEWTCDVVAVVRELGRGLLTSLAGKARPKEELLADWRAQAGDAWAEHVSLDLLVGDYLLKDAPASAMISETGQLVEYFPVHTLPAHAPTRFADLFLTRQRWRPDDMIPFMRGLYPEGDTKARDKLVAKYVRVVKEREGQWWYPRRTG